MTTAACGAGAFKQQMTEPLFKRVDRADRGVLLEVLLEAWALFLAQVLPPALVVIALEIDPSDWSLPMLWSAVPLGLVLATSLARSNVNRRVRRSPTRAL